MPVPATCHTCGKCTLPTTTAHALRNEVSYMLTQLKLKEDSRKYVCPGQEIGRQFNCQPVGLTHPIMGAGVSALGSYRARAVQRHMSAARVIVVIVIRLK